MKTYITHKHVKAEPMTRGDYNELRGWRVPHNENPDDAGYLVEYLDSPNDSMPSGFENYISWCPKAQFEEGSTEINDDYSVKAEYIDKLVESLEYKFTRVGDTTITACWAFLPGGFEVGYGKSGCVNPDKYDAATGERIAQENCRVDAIQRLWQYEGYKLATL